MCLTNKQKAKMLRLATKCFYINSLDIEAEVTGSNYEAIRCSFTAYAGTPNEESAEKNGYGEYFINMANQQARLTVLVDKTHKHYATMVFIKFYLNNKLVHKKRVKFPPSVIRHVRKTRSAKRSRIYRQREAVSDGNVLATGQS